MSLIINQLLYVHPNREMLFENISFSVSKGQKVSLIGNNGSGKSTLLQIIAGKLKAAAGDVVFSDKPYYIPQHFGQYDALTVAQALGVDKKINALHEILAGSVSEENFNTLNDDWGIEERALTSLSSWDLQDVELSQNLNTLSGGEKTKVFLSGLEIHNPNIILLDEPTNHLDKTARRKLYDYIRTTKSSVLLVSHDRKLLNLVDFTLELTSNGVEVYGGNYDFYKIQKEEKIYTLQEQIAEKEKELRKARKTARESIERQEKHATRGEKQNLKKGIPRIAMKNLGNKSEKKTARLKEIHVDKIDNIVSDMKEAQQKLPLSKELKLNIENTNLHKGKMLVDAKGINFAYSNQPLWPVSFDFQIRSGERILISGDNGSGKTTLIKLALGKLKPSIGDIVRADFSYLYIDQEYSFVDDRLTVFEQVEKFNAACLPEHDLKMLLHRFLFNSKSWEKICGQLSGGEKMKLALCCLQISNNMPDLFVLDEPTNNLDIQNIEIITSLIKSYQGTLLLISHDETFVEEIGIEQEISLSNRAIE